MKSKHLLLLVVLLAILGGAALLLSQRERASWQASPSAAGRKVLPGLEPGAVAQLRIRNADGSVTIARKGDAWVVTERAGYPADFDRIRDLVRRLWELEAGQDVAANEGQFAELRLVEPTEGRADAGSLIELSDASGKRIAALLAGKTHNRPIPGLPGREDMPVGRYVVALGDRKRVVLVSDPLPELDSPARDWLRKDFVRVENPRSISLSGPKGAWTLERAAAGDPWKLDGGDADAGKAEAVFNAVRGPVFENVAAADAKADFSKPDVLTVRTLDGFTYVWTIGAPEGTTVPVKVAVSADLAKQRTPGKDEKPEDRERLDREFAENREALETRLANEKPLEGWTYFFPQAAFAAALIPSKDLKPSPSPTPAANAQSAPAAPNP